MWAVFLEFSAKAFVSVHLYSVGYVGMTCTTICDKDCEMINLVPLRSFVVYPMHKGQRSSSCSKVVSISDMTNSIIY